jgi:hypothetical protein
MDIIRKLFNYEWIKLCKVRGYDGSECEECRILVYKNLVRTSQETFSPLQSPAG